MYVSGEERHHHRASHKGRGRNGRARSVDPGNELVLDDRAVLLPVLAVLERAPLEVAPAAVDEDGDEEHGVEVRDRGARALREAPGERHDPVGDVVLRGKETGVW